MTTKTLLISAPIVSTTADLRALDRYDLDVLIQDYVITNHERVRRATDPLTTFGEGEPVALTSAQREAFGRAELLIALDAPIDLGTVAPNLRWIQAVVSGVGQFA